MVFNEIFTLHDLQHCSEDQCIDSVYPQSGHSGRVFLMIFTTVMFSILQRDPGTR